MNIILVLVSSVDGKITKGDNPNIYTWTSKEDQDHFFGLIKQHELILMGRKTYEASKPVIKLVPGKKRIVMTSSPDEFAREAVPDQLEFTSDTPDTLIKKLEKEGHQTALLVGGSQLAGSFLKLGLVNELILTLEPYLFGVGRNLLEGTELAVNLNLIEVKRLNSQGTLLLRYSL